MVARQGLGSTHELWMQIWSTTRAHAYLGKGVVHAPGCPTVDAKHNATSDERIPGVQHPVVVDAEYFARRDSEAWRPRTRRNDCRTPGVNHLACSGVAASRRCLVDIRSVASVCNAQQGVTSSWRHKQATESTQSWDAQPPFGTRSMMRPLRVRFAATLRHTGSPPLFRADAFCVGTFQSVS